MKEFPRHKKFWNDLGIGGNKKLYDSLVATSNKVLDLLDVLCTNHAEQRVFGYLKSLIGNMGLDQKLCLYCQENNHQF